MGEALITRRGGGGGMDMTALLGGRFSSMHLTEQWGSETTVRVGNSLTLQRQLSKDQWNNALPSSFRPTFGVFEIQLGNAGNRFDGSLYKFFAFPVVYGEDTTTDFYLEFDDKTAQLQIVSRFITNSGGSYMVEAVVTLASYSTATGTVSVNGEIGAGVYSFEHIGS